MQKRKRIWFDFITNVVGCPSGSKLVRSCGKGTKVEHSISFMIVLLLRLV